MGRQSVEAWERLQLRERSKVAYFIKYGWKSIKNKFFTPSPFSEILLSTTFDLFYKNWAYNVEPVPARGNFNSESEFEEAYELYLEIKGLLEYWRDRGLNHKSDRVKDDQMMIRLVKIRHKLNFDC
jgi:hypothetical protein